MKIEKCPFCGGEAHMVRWASGIKYCRVECKNTDSCDCHGIQFLTEEESIAAWNRRAQPENKPLALDELRGMDGEPVWTVTNGVEGSGRWEILESVDNEFMRLCNPVDTTYDCPIDTYGKTWLAYRSKPERSKGK